MTLEGDIKKVGEPPLAICPPSPGRPDREGTEGCFLHRGAPTGNSQYTEKAAESARDFPVWIDRLRPQLNQTNKLTKFISKFMFKPSPVLDD